MRKFHAAKDLPVCLYNHYVPRKERLPERSTQLPVTSWLFVTGLLTVLGSRKSTKPVIDWSCQSRHRLSNLRSYPQRHPVGCTAALYMSWRGNGLQGWVAGRAGASGRNTHRWVKYEPAKKSSVAATSRTVPN